jgi:hypothetical protein
MSFRVFNQKLARARLDVADDPGIVFLCQPWIEVLHEYSVTIMLIGLIGFNVAVHIPPPEPLIDEDDTGPVSLSHAVKSGGGHG